MAALSGKVPRVGWEGTSMTIAMKQNVHLLAGSGKSHLTAEEYLIRCLFTKQNLFTLGFSSIIKRGLEADLTDNI